MVASAKRLRVGGGAQQQDIQQQGGGAGPSASQGEAGGGGTDRAKPRGEGQTATMAIVDRGKQQQQQHPASGKRRQAGAKRHD